MHLNSYLQNPSLDTFISTPNQTVTRRGKFVKVILVLFKTSSQALGTQDLCCLIQEEEY